MAEVAARQEAREAHVEGSPLRQRRVLKTEGSPEMSQYLNEFKDFMQYHQPSYTKATTNLIKGLSLCVLGISALAFLPWYCLPLGWFLLGTAQIALTTIAHDCKDDVFVSNKLLNWLVGMACLIPLGVDLQGYKTSLERASSDTSKRDRIVRWLAQSHLWIFASPVEWLFNLYETHLANWRRVKISIVANLVTMYAIISFFVLLMWFKVGVWGLLKYYFFPLMVYHFWRSTLLKMDKSLPSFNLPDLPNFQFGTSEDNAERATGDSEDRRKAQPQIYYYKYPQWIEFMTNNFNVATTKFKENIPSYNLKAALKELDTEEISFSWIRTILSNYRNETAQTATWTWKDIDYVTGSFIIIVPLLGIYGLFTCEYYWKTFAVAFLFYCFRGFGITMGYHRLFSHLSWDAVTPVKIFATIMGSMAFEGSVISWCKDHRVHHRYTDTNEDPYNAKKGMLWAHMGWLFFNRTYKYSDVRDLEALWYLRLQHDYYAVFSLFFGMVLPWCICGFGWGDWAGGFYFAFALSTATVLQATFCINSIAHWWGDATFSDQRTPRDSHLVSLLTFGEGYHNFHHEFPFDYRNGIQSYAFDPTKWVVTLLEYFGLAYKVQRTAADVYTKGRIQMEEKRLAELKSKLPWGTPLEDLPVVTWEELSKKRGDDANFTVVDGVVYEMGVFIDKHPGGRGMIAAYLGKDATNAFNGGVYNHSYAARNILDCLRIAKLAEGEVAPSHH